MKTQRAGGRGKLTFPAKSNMLRVDADEFFATAASAINLQSVSELNVRAIQS